MMSYGCFHNRRILIVNNKNGIDRMLTLLTVLIFNGKNYY